METVTISRETYDSLMRIKHISEGKIVRHTKKIDRGCGYYYDTAYLYMDKAEFNSEVLEENVKLFTKLQKNNKEICDVVNENNSLKVKLEKLTNCTTKKWYQFWK